MEVGRAQGCSGGCSTSCRLIYHRAHPPPHIPAYWRREGGGGHSNVKCLDVCVWDLKKHTFCRTSKVIKHNKGSSDNCGGGGGGILIMAFQTMPPSGIGEQTNLGFSSRWLYVIRPTLSTCLLMIIIPDKTIEGKLI